MSLSPVNLEELSLEQFQQFLDSFDHVCCDCDGVLWSGGEPIDGAGAAVSLLAARNKTLAFVSNNSTVSPENYRELFRRAGVENGYERLITPAWALCRWLHSNEVSGPLYCAASERTVQALTEGGFQCITGPSQADATMEEVARLSAAPPGVTAVVMDSDYAINIHKLHRCVAALADPSVLFLSGAPDKRVPLGPGLSIMGAGVFTALVAAESGREPLVLAKPSRALGDMLLKHANISNPSRTLFIGDSMEQDIRFANTMGFHSLLVLSGVSSLYDAKRMLGNADANTCAEDKHVRPEYYVASLGRLLDKLHQC